MTSNHRLARIYRIVVGGMDSTLPTVLADDLIVDPNRPSLFPKREMVAQMDAIDALVFGRYSCEPRLESGVVIAKRPYLPTPPRQAANDVMEVILSRLKFGLETRRTFPPNRRVAADLWEVEYVAVEDNGGRLKLLAELFERSKTGRFGAGPNMEIRTNDNAAVFDLKLASLRVLFRRFRPCWSDDRSA
jgi:hypothetical protein